MAPSDPIYRFDDFRLDVSNRQLWKNGTPVDLNARYFDALVLLVREQGRLVEKDRFFNEVWGDVVVSDSALTQCIKDIRRLLGDDATNPRYVVTVPRYGYRFIGAVETEPAGTALVAPASLEDPHPGPALPPERVAIPLPTSSLVSVLVLVLAGTVGGALAGVFGGLFYGFGVAYTPAVTGLGTASVVLVLVALNVLLGAAGAFGVSSGLALGRLAGRRSTAAMIAGAAMGGLVVGGLVKLFGVDAFNLLFGRAPAGITGGPEGAVLGAALALGLRLGGGFEAATWTRPVLGAAGVGALAGVFIPLAGGRLMGGSLELLARSFSGSRLQLDAMGRFFGELHFGHTTQVVLGGLEGLVFSGFVAAALVLSRRSRWITGDHRP